MSSNSLENFDDRFFAATIIGFIEFGKRASGFPGEFNRLIIDQMITLFTEIASPAVYHKENRITHKFGQYQLKTAVVAAEKYLESQGFVVEFEWKEETGWQWTCKYATNSYTYKSKYDYKSRDEDMSF